MKDTDLEQQISELHREAFELTQEVIEQGSALPDQLEQGELISQRLGRLQSEVARAEEIAQAESNVKLDEIRRYLAAINALGEVEEERPDQEISRLSNESFLLAKKAARSERLSVDLERRAREINSRLEEIWPEIQSADADQQPHLNQTWNDARLDVGYVLSGGELATSTRLHHYIRTLD